MKIIEKKFKQTLSGSWKCDELFLCRTEMDELFNIPKNKTTIWVSLHTTRRASRYKAKIQKNTRDKIYLGILNTHSEVNNEYFDPIFDKLLNKTVYVEVRYEK
ncbi:hypothetical protein KAR91_82720 [Candidatus Pacearchaeota archaeon]|nr:hypothetical protein [Candidatus Pacearchaeota archaeon]